MPNSLSLGAALETIAEQFAAADLYFGHGTDNAWDEACFLILSICQLPLDSDDSVSQKLLTPREQQTIFALAEARIARKIPLAYLLQEAWFAGLRFYVDERVLVPRSSFAELITQGFAPWVDISQIHQVLDLCTGSGCMAIATAHYWPQLQVDASDLSADALAVAQRNCQDYQLEGRVTLYQSDSFKNLPAKQYDLIISNPPYVDQADMAALPAEYRHEPELGLASGVDGLSLTKHILANAKQYLTPHGVLMVEVGNSQEALMEQFPKLPFTWVDFEWGDTGIFVLHARDLPE